MTEEFISLGEVGYRAYGDNREWKAYNGEPMPLWEVLPSHIQEAWTAAAKAIETAVLNTDTD